MILNKQNMSENNWNPFKIVPWRHHNCQLSIVNCQFGEAAKYPYSQATKRGHATACPGLLVHIEKFVGVHGCILVGHPEMDMSADGRFHQGGISHAADGLAQCDGISRLHGQLL